MEKEEEGEGGGEAHLEGFCTPPLRSESGFSLMLGRRGRGVLWRRGRTEAGGDMQRSEAGGRGQGRQWRQPDPQYTEGRMKARRRKRFLAWMRRDRGTRLH